MERREGSHEQMQLVKDSEAALLGIISTLFPSVPCQVPCFLTCIVRGACYSLRYEHSNNDNYSYRYWPLTDFQNCPLPFPLLPWVRLSKDHLCGTLGAVLTGDKKFRSSMGRLYCISHCRIHWWWEFKTLFLGFVLQLCELPCLLQIRKDTSVRTHTNHTPGFVLGSSPSQPYIFQRGVQWVSVGPFSPYFWL